MVLTCLWEALKPYKWKMDHRGEAAVFTLGSAFGCFLAFWSGSLEDTGACIHEVVLLLAFPCKAEPSFSHRLLGCLLLSDATGISLM